MKHIPQPDSTPDFFALTFGDVVGKYVVLANCKTCNHRSKLDLQSFADRYGKDAPTAKLKGCLSCSVCGARGPILTTVQADSQTARQLLQGLERDSKKKLQGKTRSIEAAIARKRLTVEKAGKD